MIKLLNLLKETISSNIYKITFQNNNFEISESNLGEISKLSNLSYDMGGGEYIDDPSINSVVVDYIKVEDFAKYTLNEWGDELNIKYYILQDLNKSFSFPKANKIILSKVVIYIKDIEILAESVNNSLNDRLGNNGLFFNTETTEQKNTPSEDLMCLKISPGKAYVRGYDVEKISTTIVDVDKPRDTEKVDNVNVPFQMGNIISIKR
jgi:hypothetical protein